MSNWKESERRFLILCREAAKKYREMGKELHALFEDDSYLLERFNDKPDDRDTFLNRALSGAGIFAHDAYMLSRMYFYFPDAPEWGQGKLHILARKTGDRINPDVYRKRTEAVEKHKKNKPRAELVKENRDLQYENQQLQQQLNGKVRHGAKPSANGHEDSDAIVERLTKENNELREKNKEYSELASRKAATRGITIRLSPHELKLVESAADGHGVERWAKKAILAAAKKKKKAKATA